MNTTNNMNKYNITFNKPSFLSNKNPIKINTKKVANKVIVINKNSYILYCHANHIKINFKIITQL